MQGVTLKLWGTEFTGAIVRDYYTGSGAPALEFIDFEAGERIAVLSVNVGPMRAREVAIKDWTENEGTLAGLIALGIVRDTGARIGCGWCEAAVCEIIAPELLVSEEKAGAVVSQTLHAVKRHTTQCPRGCDHSDAEHRAFDQGVLDGEGGDKEASYSEPELHEAYASGYSVGALNRADRGAAKGGAK